MTAPSVALVSGLLLQPVVTPPRAGGHPRPAAGRHFLSAHRSDVVFHAALKHLLYAEEVPDRGQLTNVVGTSNVLDTAQNAGVAVVVNIYTDKAADPTSVRGYSKRVSERFAAGMAPAGQAAPS